MKSTKLWFPMTPFYPLGREACSKSLERNVEDYIYDVALPQLEHKDIFLCSNGILDGCSSDCRQEKYMKRKHERSLFDIPRIVKVLEEIDHLVTPTRKTSSSYSLKHKLERSQKQYISNGNCIMALLLAGEEAVYYGVGPNCDFKVKSYWEIKEDNLWKKQHKRGLCFTNLA